MYDLADDIELEMPTTGENKLLVCRHPTTQEWIDRVYDRTVVTRTLGRGENETKAIDREKTDMRLLAAIQKNTEVKFEEAEAVVLMDQLATCEVIDAVRQNGMLTVTMSTLFGEVTHVVNIPTQKDLKAATESSIKARGGRFNATTYKIDMKPTAALYDIIATNVEGYDVKEPKDVPIIHKHKVIDTLHAEITQITVRKKGVNPAEAPLADGR